MTYTHGSPRKNGSWWTAVWPFWALVALGSLAAVRLLPAGYLRAVAAVPILLVVPGSLVLGAVFSGQARPRGPVFVCFAVLLSTIESAFVSLALYVLNVRITADSTYWSLLAVSASLAIVAQARLLLDRPGKGRRGVQRPEVTDPDLSAAEVDQNETSVAAVGACRYAFAAVLAGAMLLAGATYAYEHLPQPAPVGYTWMAWRGPPITGAIATGSAGTMLHFQIVHHQPGITTFQLSAAWLGSPSLPLAKSMTLRIGPDQTFHGTLSVPPLPNGCTYRVLVALTASRQIDPLTKKLQTWSINADVHDPGKSSKACR